MRPFSGSSTLKMKASCYSETLQLCIHTTPQRKMLSELPTLVTLNFNSIVGRPYCFPEYHDSSKNIGIH
jgi:hypothetical protein